MGDGLSGRLERILGRLNLPPESRYQYARLKALRQLSKFSSSDERIVTALKRASESDPDERVRQMATQVFLSPVHQEFIKAHPAAVQVAPKWPAWLDDPLDALPDNATEVLRFQFRAMQFQARLLMRLADEAASWHQEQLADAWRQRATLRGIKTTTDILGILLILGIIGAVLSCLTGGGLLGLSGLLGLGR